MMTGLLDIAPAAERVDIRGIQVDVRGLSLTDLRDLIARFPEVVALFGKGLNVGAIMKAGPAVVAAAIAAACGNPGDKAAEAIAGDLPLGEQADILDKVLRLTMPKGPGPFVALLKTVGLDLATVLPGSKVSAAASPQPPTPSSEPGIASKKS